MNTDKEEIRAVPNPKLQIPNKGSNPKFQMEDRDKSRDLFRFWRLSFPWDLGIWIWNFRKATAKELVDKVPPSFSSMELMRQVSRFILLAASGSLLFLTGCQTGRVAGGG